MRDPFVSVIIAAAGNSSRMESDVSKQLINISGKSVLEYSLISFSKSRSVREIIISAKTDEMEVISKYKSSYPKISAVVEGGKTRSESVSNAFVKISPLSELVAIHDAARPLISVSDIDAIIEEANKYDAVCPVSAVADTVKLVNNGCISSTIDRNSIFLASTPQTFKTSIYKQALYNCETIDHFTDDCSIVESIGQKVHVYVMKNDNKKITTLKDLEEVKEKLLEKHKKTKIGHGYDVHKLTSERKLILGGVNIPHTKGLLGHSDADVLVHAIMDSILGAAGLRDIGSLFPDTDNQYKGISSIELLKKVNNKIKNEGYAVSNIDATIIAQAPKLSEYIPEMIKNIAEALNVDKSDINVKATTEEHLGFTGEELGISAHSVCLIKLQ